MARPDKRTRDALRRKAAELIVDRMTMSVEKRVYSFAPESERAAAKYARRAVDKAERANNAILRDVPERQRRQGAAAAVRIVRDAEGNATGAWEIVGNKATYSRAPSRKLHGDAAQIGRGSQKGGSPNWWARLERKYK